MLFVNYTINQGLANNVIYAIEEDNDGKLWLSTNNGLSCFDVKNEKFTNYNKHDGLQSTEFNLQASFKNSSGELFFGGVNGLNYFKPINTINTIPPNLDITRITVFQKGGTKIFKKPLNGMLPLSYNQNSLQIEFVALHSKNPKKQRYAYQLANWGKEWITTGDQRKVMFINLPPGNYYFKVKACNSDGIWNQKPKSVKIIIAPPFWKTSWAVISYLLLIGLILYYLHRKKLAQEIKIIKIKEQERLKTKEEIDFDLHDDLGGGINSIIHICHERLYKESSYDQLTTAIRKILNLAKNLDSELREYVWEVESTKSTLEDLIFKLRSNADSIFDEDEYDFQLENHISDAIKIEIPLKTRRAIVKIFKEGMTNILKHSNSCKKINLKFQQTSEGYLEISLSDDGVGFDPSENHLGKGLKSMYRRLEKINGELKILSGEGKGTKIILRVKLS